MMDSYTSLIASSFSLNSQLLWWLIIGVTSLFVSFVIRMYFGSALLSMLAMPVPFVFGITLGYIPFWAAFIVIFPAIYVLWMSQGESIEQDELKPYWEQYGDNLKNAYTSKFGGENPAFNQEVDNHVKIMVNNGRGFTKALANDWMKRMGKFTESK